MFRPPSPTPCTLNLAPMVDVMMCLIIFFLLASQLLAARHARVNLPTATAARVDDAASGQRAVINVRLAANGCEYVVEDWDGRAVGERVLAAPALRAFLVSRRSAAAEGDFGCLIRADRDAPYSAVEAVLRACAESGIARVAFAAQTVRPSEPKP